MSRCWRTRSRYHGSKNSGSAPQLCSAVLRNRLKGKSEMEQLADARILTINQVAEILQCSKAHVSNALNSKVANVLALTHFSLGRRKLIRREWLEAWLEDY